ncbi:MAG: tyrosine-type recombinase/integrase [bacterium]|nr:tyrosine-type recombinase/integrase [bacterium]
MEKESRHLTKYIEHLALIKKFSPHTVKAYTRDIRNFLDYFREGKLDVNKANIRDYISSVFLRTKNKATVSRTIYSLRSFYSYLMKQGVVARNPFDVISVPRIEKKLPEILTEREVIAFLDILPTETFLQLRNKAVFEFLYATGLRISELLNLRLTDIDFHEGMVRVLGKGNKERIVPFHDGAGEILKEYIEAAVKKFKAPVDYVFLNFRGKKITERAIEDILGKTYCALMESNKRVYPHLFRHSYATHLLQRGANLRVIQELLGHSDLSTTEKYTNLNYADLLKVYRKFHPRGK